MKEKRGEKGEKKGRKEVKRRNRIQSGISYNLANFYDR